MTIYSLTLQKRARGCGTRRRTHAHRVLISFPVMSRFLSMEVKLQILACVLCGECSWQNGQENVSLQYLLIAQCSNDSLVSKHGRCYSLGGALVKINKKNSSFSYFKEQNQTSTEECPGESCLWSLFSTSNGSLSCTMLTSVDPCHISTRAQRASFHNYIPYMLILSWLK